VNTRFDAYEIAPVLDDGDTCAQCISLADAQERATDGDTIIWSLYGHLPEGGVLCIGDFKSYDDAAEVYSLITGEPAPENPDLVMFYNLPAGHQENHHA
jgi:hypothetical protein